MPKKHFLKGISFNLNILQSKQISMLVIRQKSPEVSGGGLAVTFLGRRRVIVSPSPQNTFLKGAMSYQLTEAVV